MTALELKIPPVAMVVAFAFTMWVVTTRIPSLAIDLPWRVPVAACLAGAGLVTSLAGVLVFHRAGTTTNPTRPGAASVMVTSGIYRCTRNPMYLGFLLALVGWAAFLSHALAFAGPPFFVACMDRFQILPEERALAAKFGPQFAAYRRSVRRWL
jgi:protein-S-isoprenylcysteine O-methyltransferase Ste14